MKRFFLLLPVLVAVPFVASLAAPAPTKPTPAKPKVTAPAKTQAPSVAKPKIHAPRKAQPHDHDHDHDESPATPGKAKDPINDSLDYLWKQSDEAFHKGDYPTAVKLHRAIVTLDPTDTESFGVGAWLLWSMDQKSAARDFIAQGLGANAANPEMWNVAGQHYDLEKSFSDAKNAYQQAVQLSNGKAPELLRRRLAHASEHAGDLDLSVQTWTTLARDFPNTPVNKNNLARVKALQAKNGV